MYEIMNEGLFLENGDVGLQSPSPSPSKTSKRTVSRDRRPLTGMAFSAQTCGVQPFIETAPVFHEWCTPQV